MAFADLRSELTCPVCWEIYTDPVTLPCGHNYCRVCIGRHWERQEGIEEDPSCPECRHTYWRHPELNRNLRLHSVAELFLPTDPEQECSGIFCTYCDISVPAAKSCLHCEASLCSHHLAKHSKSAKHILVDPTKPERKQCLMHGRNLEFNCTEDGATICASCWLAGGHRGHRVKLLNETEREAQRLQERRREGAELAAGETEGVTALFRDIRERLEALEMRLLRDISRHNEKVSLRLFDPMQELEIWKGPFGEMLSLKDSYNMTKHPTGTESWDKLRIGESQTDPDLWSLISKKLLTGLDEIVVTVKEKIHGHQVRGRLLGIKTSGHTLKDLLIWRGWKISDPFQGIKLIQSFGP